MYLFSNRFTWHCQQMMDHFSFHEKLIEFVQFSITSCDDFVISFTHLEIAVETENSFRDNLQHDVLLRDIIKRPRQGSKI